MLGRGSMCVIYSYVVLICRVSLFTWVFHAHTHSSFFYGLLLLGTPTLIIEISSEEMKSFFSTFYGQKYLCFRECNNDSLFRDDPGLYLQILGGGGFQGSW